MVVITKKEKKLILQKFPNTHIRRTAKQDSKRHHYYCEEASWVLDYLDKIRLHVQC